MNPVAGAGRLDLHVCDPGDPEQVANQEGPEVLSGVQTLAQELWGPSRRVMQSGFVKMLWKVHGTDGGGRKSH